MFLAERKAQEEKLEVVEQEIHKKNHQKAIEHQMALYNQLEENERRKKEEYEQFLKEKEMVDQIVHKINEENERFP